MDFLAQLSFSHLLRLVALSTPLPMQIVFGLTSTLMGAVCSLGKAAPPPLSNGAPSEVPLYGLSPPVYPTPIANGTSTEAWAEAHKKARYVVSQMTLDELASFTHGWPGPCVGNTYPIDRLGLPSLCFYDGPDGLRGQEFVSAFPAGIHLAATFDKDLMHRYGRALGDEFHGRGVHIALGPSAGPLGRIARGGRNWEGLSNDPYLAGAAMGAITRGIQDAGVISTLKHWLLNEQEYRRRQGHDAGEIFYHGAAISSNVDDRTLHELYAFPFMNALREGAGGVMCSYQRANQSYACQNSKLMNGVLKTELGFEGFVVSDWNAQMTGVASAAAGLDIVMPDGGYWGNNISEAVRNGSLNMNRVTDMARRILAPYYLLRQDIGYPETTIYDNKQQHSPVDVQADHAELIREIGAVGTVLVKNVNQTLPFKNPRYLCVYGYDATVKSNPWENRDRYGGGYEVNFGWNTFNGTLVTGGGSGSTTPPYVVSPFHAIQERIMKARGVLRWDFNTNTPTPYLNSEACLVFLNAYAGESFDRTTLVDAFSAELVSNIASWCPNTIVTIHSAGIALVDPWIDHPNVTAVIYGGLPGQESGNSLVSVLWGETNPSGRMPYTVAKKAEDYGKLLNSTVTKDYFSETNFDEGLFIDYKAFEKDGIEPRFEFGFGLSYTEFGYGGLQASLLSATAGSGSLGEYPDPDVAIVQGGHPQLWNDIAMVICTIQNIGEVEGTEVAQLYVGFPGAGESDKDTPVRQLRGFERVGPLKPGVEKEISFSLTRRDLSVWDVVAQQWKLRRGAYKVWVGSSSRDLRLDGELVI